MKQERLKKLLAVMAEKSKIPNNSYEQYDINRDFGFIAGICQALYYADDLENVVIELESVYLNQNK